MEALSDGIGLEHSLLAAKVGDVTISLRQEDGTVSFQATLAVEGAPRQSSECDPSTSPSLFSLDELSLLPSAPRHSNSVHVIDGAAARFPSLEPGTPPPRDPPTAPDFPRGLRFCILDDTASSLRVLEHSIRHACPTADIMALGAEESDVERFMAIVAEGADIVILDQHLEYGESYLGTTVARRLRLLGYNQLLCIRSASDSPEDRRLYAACGAHCVVGKDVPGSQMMNVIRSAFWTLHNDRV